MMFGNAQQADPSLSEYVTSENDGGERLEEAKAAAYQVAGRVGNKASELGQAVSDWFTQFTAKE